MTTGPYDLTALVAGANTGIGHGLAVGLVTAGADVSARRGPAEAREPVEARGVDTTVARQAEEIRNRPILERMSAGCLGDSGEAAVFLDYLAADYVQGRMPAIDIGWPAR